MMRKIEDGIVLINPWHWKSLFPSIPNTHYLWIGVGISNSLFEIKIPLWWYDQFYWLVCYRGILKESQVDWDLMHRMQYILFARFIVVHLRWTAQIVTKKRKKLLKSAKGWFATSKAAVGGGWTTLCSQREWFTYSHPNSYY
jgi:hypothetical protein